MGQYDRRHSGRLETKQRVICRNSEGILPAVWLADLATSGCQVTIRQGHLDVGQHVVVRMEGLEGLSGVVRWVDKARAGIEFSRELHPSVLDHLLNLHQTLVGHPINLSFGMVDHFGRLLPDLPSIKNHRGDA